MEWLAIAIVGALIGTLVSFVAQQSVEMPQWLCIVLSVVGALAGGAIARIANFSALGTWTFYITGAVVALGLFAGGLLAFTLTRSEKRV